MEKAVFMPHKHRCSSETRQLITHFCRRPAELIENPLIEFDKPQKLIGSFEVVDSWSLDLRFLPFLELLLHHLHFLANQLGFLRILIQEDGLVAQAVELPSRLLVFIHEAIWVMVAGY